MKEKPLRCGWCGGTPMLDDFNAFQFFCDECGTSGPCCETEDRAREAWDRIIGLKDADP